MAAVALAQRLRAERDDLSVLITGPAEGRPSPNGWLIPQQAPEDRSTAVRRFLDHWRPDAALWTGADQRPALAGEAARRDIPLILVETREATPEIAAPRWWRGRSGRPLSRFSHLLTGDEASAAALRRLGAPADAIEILGYLEEGAAAQPCNEAERDDMAAVIAGRPVWLAMCVEPGEIAAVLQAHRRALRRAHRLLLILVPSDPRLAPDWANDVAEQGLRTALRSHGAEPDADVQVYIADADIEAEAGLWYRLAPIAFLGRSLEAGGGLNPFEAAALGAAILHGPNVRRYRGAYSRLAVAGAARPVRNADELGAAVELLLSPEMAAAMAHEAWKVCSSGAEVTDRAIALICEALDRAEAG